MNNNLSSRLSSFPTLQNLVEQIFPPSGKPDSSTQHGHLGQNLPKKEYELILAYLNDNHSLPTFRHFKDFPHPTDASLLPRLAKLIQHITVKGHHYTTYDMHHGNASVTYWSLAGHLDAGLIRSIYRQIVRGVTHTFICIAPCHHTRHYQQMMRS
jgi:hypothetical protein